MKLTKPLATTSSMLTLREDLDRLMDRLFSGSIFAPPPRIFETVWSPALDFSETEKEYVVRLEVPGMAREDLQVNLDGQTLTLTGQRDFSQEEKTEEYFWREREQGRFVRTVQLPSPVDAAKVEATYTGGVMTVRLPKKEPAVKTRIPIK